MNKISQTLIQLALSLGLMTLSAGRAYAVSIEQIQGTWKSVRSSSGAEGATSGTDEHLMAMQLKFDVQNHFQMNHSLVVSEGSETQESMYMGDFAMSEDQILANATTLQISYQGQQKQMILNPPRSVLLEIISWAADKMTLRIGGDNLVVEFERVP